MGKAHRAGGIMELRKALQLQVEYFGRNGTIRVDENAYVCLNDLNEYFPNKRLDNWLRLDTTNDFIKTVDKILNTSDVRELGSSVVAKRGRHKSGTFAHKWVAQKFAMWLSPEFELSVIQAYESGEQRKQNWNIKRILAANNFKIMCEAIQTAHEPAKPYHYSNEARMVNGIVFGAMDFDRDTATEPQLDAVAHLEASNGTLIDLGFEYQERKEKLAVMYQQKYLPRHPGLIQLSAAS
jgi:hypothetical protein